jgi:amino acid transporter
MARGSYGEPADSPHGEIGPEQVTAEAGLQRNAINWKHVAVLSVAGCGPASVIALNLQFMGQFAGAALVLAFVFVWPGILLLVNTFVEFSKRLPSSGGLYTWNAKAWGNNVGFVYGWVFLGSYLVFSAAGFAVFGGWVEQYLQTEFSVTIPWWLFTGLALVYVTALAYRGIQQTLHAAVGLLVFEMVVLLGLAATIIVAGGGGVTGPADAAMSLDVFKPSAVNAVGWTAVGLAMTYAVLSHVGIEEGSTLGHEVEDPRRGIPRGLWITAVIVPAFYVFTAYAMVNGYGIDNMKAFGEDAAPLQTLAKSYWGSFGLSIVVLATISSILAFSQTAFTAGARVLYTMGREGVLPRWLGAISPRHTPHHAIWFMGVSTIVLGVPLAALTAPFDVWGYFGFLISIAFLVSYIVTNLALIKYTRDIGEFRLLRHGILPVLGAVVFAYPLYRTIWPLAPGAYGVLPFVYVGWIALGIVVLFVAKARRPDVLDSMGSSLAEGDATLDEPAPTPLAPEPATAPAT